MLTALSGRLHRFDYGNLANGQSRCALAARRKNSFADMNFPFIGGVALDSRKAPATNCLIDAPPLPQRSIYPLAGERSIARAAVIVGQRVLKGQPLSHSEHYPCPPIHAATSGYVSAIESRILPYPSSPSGLCIVVETDGLDESAELNGIIDFEKARPDELRKTIHEAGIVGLGGAAFPTAVKLDASGIDTLIINGVECEPHISCDDALLRHYPRETLQGGRIALRMLGARRCIVALKQDMLEAIASLTALLAEDEYETMRLATLPAIYPMGSEKQLVKTLTGREVPAGGLPADAGVVCINVGTAAAVFRAVVRGEALTSRIVTVTGAGVAAPRNIHARIGTPVAELIRLCGGYTPSARRLILGGPMMGYALPSDEVPIVKSANCILVAGAEDIAGENVERPCIRCGECAQVCPAGLLPQQLHWHIRANKPERVLEHRLQACIECGCCDYVCPSHIPLTRNFRIAKDMLKAQAQARENAERARVRFEARQMRKERENREKTEQDRRKKELLAKARATQHTPQHFGETAGSGDNGFVDSSPPERQ